MDCIYRQNDGHTARKEHCMRKGRNVYKRKDGRWGARVLIGRRADGCPQYKYLYGGTYRAALQKRRILRKMPLARHRSLFIKTLCVSGMPPCCGWMIPENGGSRPVMFVTRIAWKKIFCPNGEKCPCGKSDRKITIN